jgi:hypothetical protein
MTLRPEMTASVARSVVEKGLLKTAKSLRLYYMGPMFRAERPQAAPVRLTSRGRRLVRTVVVALAPFSTYEHGSQSPRSSDGLHYL